LDNSVSVAVIQRKEIGVVFGIDGLVIGPGFDSGDGGIGEQNLGPFMLGDAVSSGEGWEIHVTLCITSGVHGNVTKEGPGAYGVGRGQVVKNPDVWPNSRKIELKLGRGRPSMREEGLDP
jgi:hypothetical protein